MTWTAPSLQMCGVMLSGSEESTPSIIYHCVLRGLERLLLSEQLSRLDTESLVKLSVDRVNVHSPHRAMAALGLMLTCMYTGEQWRQGWPRPTGSEPQTVRVSCHFSGCRPHVPPRSQGDSRAWRRCPAPSHMTVLVLEAHLGNRPTD